MMWEDAAAAEIEGQGGGADVDAPIAMLATATDAFAALIHDPVVEERWDEDSVCPPYTVGGMVAHVATGLVWTAKLLAADPPRDAPPVSEATSYFETVDAAGEVLHRALEADGNRRAARGVAAHRDLLRSLTAQLRDMPEADPEALLDLRPTWPGAITVADFTRTRLVEVVVHGDDVAASVGLSLHVDPAVGDCLLDFLWARARTHRRDIELVRGLVRGERAEDVFPIG
jgi:uncharacterized protein (TIGR03083 family)